MSALLTASFTGKTLERVGQAFESVGYGRPPGGEVTGKHLVEHYSQWLAQPEILDIIAYGLLTSSRKRFFTLQDIAGLAAVFQEKMFLRSLQSFRKRCFFKQRIINKVSSFAR